MLFLSHAVPDLAHELQDVDQRKLREREDWEELFADLVIPPAVKNENSNPDLDPTPNPIPSSRLFVM